VAAIEDEIRERFGRIPAFFEPALASPDVLRELWRETQVEWLQSAVPEHFRRALVEALADHSPWPWATVADATGSATGVHVEAAAVLNGIVEPPSERRLMKWPDPGDPEWHQLLGLALKLVVDGPDEEVRARLLALLGERRYADLVAAISYLETCRMFAQAHPGLAAAASSRFRRTADPKRLAVIELDRDGAIVSFSPAAEELFASRAEAVAKTPFIDLFDAESATSLRRLIDEYAGEDDGLVREQSVPVVGRRRDGSSFVAALSVSNQGRAGENGAMTAIVTPEPARTWSDHAAAYRLLLSLLEGGSSSVPPQAVLDGIAQALGWEYVLVWRWDPDQGVLRCAAARSLAGELPAEVHARAERTWELRSGLAGAVFDSGTPAWANDLSQSGSEELQSGLWLPLGTAADVDGVLELLSTAKREPDAALLHMLSALVGESVSAPDLAPDEPAGAVPGEQPSDDIGRAQLAFEGAPLGLALVNIDDGHAGTVAEANRALGVITRRAPEDLVGTELGDITLADDVDRDSELLGQLIAGRIPSYVIAKRMVRPDGDVFWAELSVALIRSDDGSHKPVYLVVQVADITERKRVEDALQLSRERMATVFDEAPIGMALATLDGRWLQVNAALCRTLGYSETELLAKPLREVIAEDDVETIVRYLRQVLAGEVVGYHVETRAVRADGEIIWVLLSVSLIHDSEGGPAYLLAELQDISERKRLEEELEQGALVDPVTGLPSRALLFDRLEQARQRLARTGTPFAVMFASVDGLGAVESRLGAERATTALREVAARLTAAVRAGDTVARYGADEFVVVCEDLASKDEAATIVQRIIDFGHFEVGVGERAVDLSVTVGVTIAADPADTPAALAERADAAMQAARGGGEASQEYCDSV
jgi:PAS domain S-box-containing protein/diguanylate cyclase (GGDEF)-like protein